MGEECFRTLLQTVPALTFEADAAGNATFISDQWCIYTGLTPEETAGWGWAQTLHPHEAEVVKARWAEAVRTGIPFESKHRLRAADGSYRWFIARTLPVFDGDAKIVRWAGSLTDIDDLVRTEETLRASEEFNRRLFASSSDCIKVLDLDGNLLSMNETGQGLMEIDELDPYLNRPFINFFDDDIRPKVAEALAVASAGGVGRFEAYSPSVRGKPRWWEERVTAIRGADGRPERLLVIARDTTERKRMEQELRKSQERLSLAMEFAGMGTWDADLSTEMTVWSPRHFELLGYKPAPDGRATIQMWRDRVHPEDADRVMAEYQQAQEQRRDYSIEHRIIRADDRRVRWVSAQGRYIYDADGRAVRFVGLEFDITDRKHAEEALADAKVSAERAMAAATEASRAKDHFLAVLSHELRTPLTPVLAAVSMLHEDWRIDPEVRQSLEMIRRNVELEARLIDDLLDITRIARGKIELHKQPVQLGEVVLRAVEVCQPDIEARRLHFTVHIDPDAPSWIEADVARLQQVFWNLLKNAIKFTPPGGCVGVRVVSPESKVLSPESRDRARVGTQGSVLLEVSDSGEGIEPEALPRIFNAFEQAERTITRQFGGLGLGLTISKALVEMHGGTIEADSAGKGSGAVFRVRLPLARQAALPSAAPAGAPSAAEPAPQALKVLLVEDHGDTARVLSLLLKRRGYRVQTAGDVATALELAVQRSFDLLISDLGLPDRSGVELIRELRSRGQRLPAIALSGYGQEEDVNRSREAGFNAHLTKPVDFEHFYRIIADVAGCPGG